MRRSAERVKDQGPQSVGDSPALLATTATLRAFPRWPATTMTTRRDAQLINAVTTRRDAQLINVVRKLGRTHMAF